MIRTLRAHFRQQFVGYLALFVALGGTTYAAATIGASDIKDNAVRANHIKDGAVKNPELALNSVGPGKVIDGSLGKPDLKPGLLYSGPIHLNVHVDTGKATLLKSINGIEVSASCNKRDANGVYIEIGSSTGAVVALSGTAAENGQLSNVHVGNSTFYLFGATSTQDVDLLAFNTGVGRWTGVQMGSYNGGNDGCNVWGLIIPPPS